MPKRPKSRQNRVFYSHSLQTKRKHIAVEMQCLLRALSLFTVTQFYSNKWGDNGGPGIQKQKSLQIWTDGHT